MYKGNKVSIYFPCRNEAKNLQALKSLIPTFVDEAIIVSNKSTDNTINKAHKLGFKVCVDNRTMPNTDIGYGFAHMTGIKKAKGDIIVSADGDLEHPIENLSEILDFFLKNNLDFLSCKRNFYGHKKIFLRIAGIKFLNFIIFFLYGIRIQDALSGMWIMKKNIKTKLELDEGDWNFSLQIKLNAILNPKIKFDEFNIQYRPRTAGKTNQKYLKTGLKHLYWIFKNRFTNKSQRKSILKDDEKVKKKPIINIFSHAFLPKRGGIERYVVNLEKSLIEKKYKVNIITTGLNQKLDSKSNGKNIYRVNSFWLFSGRFPVPYSIFQIFEIYRLFYKNKFTITVLNSRLFLTSIIGMYLAIFTGSKAIIIEHGSSYIKGANKLFNFLFYCYENLITVFYKVHRVDFYAVSKSSESWLKNFNIKSKGVIKNGVRNINVSESDFSINLKKNQKIILFVGRLIQEKGVIELINAFKKFNQNYRSYKLYIVGEGILEDKIKLEAERNSNIKFIGSLDNEDVLKLMSLSYVLVNPSSYPEGLPSVIIEAGLVNLPVISTLKGGLSEIIIENKTGLVLSEVSVDKIYTLLKAADSSPSYLNRLAKNLQKLVKENFLWEKNIEYFIKRIILEEEIT